jgi:penicillin-binding protein 2
MSLQDDIRLYRKREVLTRLLVLIVLLLLARLYQLQLILTDEYGRKSEENSVRTIPLEPIRGYMFDRTGKLVVDNRPAFTVSIMPYEFDRHTIPALGSVLGLDTAFILDRLVKGEAYSRFAPVKVRRDIDFPTLAVLEENRDRLPGVDYQVESKRFYTTRASAAHLLGYTKEISEGQLRALGGDYSPGDVAGATGLEALYEQKLRGRKGAEFSTVNVRGQVIGRFDNGKLDIPPLEGNDLLLTLDFSLQQFAESLMTGKRGAIVAIDPTDGGILALVSKPDYDLARFSGVTPPDLWRALNRDPATPLYNRATLTRYPPGSTFKMVLAIAALESGAITPAWRVSCGGSFRLGNKVFKDLHVHGSVDMLAALQRSCNVYFYQLMLKTGLDAWSQTAAQFGFGQATGIDIAEENAGLLPTTDYMNRRYGPQGWTKGFLPSLGIGQGELGVTPLQMACYAMALANGGWYHQPHAVRAIIDKTTKHPDTLLYQTKHIAFSPATWDVVREGMRRVVEEPGGTGGMARIKGVAAGGKTGTAQNPHGPDHAWYVGFAPFDRPTIAIAVLIENAGFGGTAAAPVAGLCLEKYLFGHPVRAMPVPAALARAGGER